MISPPVDVVHPALVQFRFDTEGLCEREGRDAYLDYLDGILDTTFLTSFRARMTGYRLGSLGVLALYASERRSSRTAELIAHDRYDAIGVQYVIGGRASGEADGRRVDSVPGSVMLLDYGRPFSITDDEPREVINVAVPRALFPATARETASWHGAILSGGAASLLGMFITGLDARLAELPVDVGPPLSDAFIATLAAALGAERRPRALDRTDLLIRRAEAIVDDCIGSSDLDPAWLASKLGASRSELYAALERFGGVSRFILQRRLSGARAALLDPADDRQIRLIAYAYGFSGESHFARAFRAHYGITATMVRRGR